MRATSNQHSASPRFPRGLVLSFLAGTLALMVFSRLSDPPQTGALEQVPESKFIRGSAFERRDQASRLRRFSNSTSSPSPLLTALTAIETEADADRRGELWSELVATIPVADISATLTELGNAGYGEHEFTRRMVRRWAETDPRAAATWAGQLPAGALRNAALADVAIEWANTDLFSAADWAKSLPDAVEQQAALLTVAYEAVRTEPVEALRLAAELTVSSERDEMIRRAAMEWALQDAVAAIEWARQIPDVALRSQVLASEAIAWADSAPESAATLAVESLPSGRLLDDTVISIVQRWAQQQPAAAAAWVEQFPSGALRLTAAENLLAQWSQTDAERAQQWRSANL